MLLNQHRPILTISEDMSGGVHNAVMVVYNTYRCQLLGVMEYHDNCTDNLIAGMELLGLQAPEVPSQLNLFMNIPVKPDHHSLSFDPPVLFKNIPTFDPNYFRRWASNVHDAFAERKWLDYFQISFTSTASKDKCIL